jgi:DNA gyrase subunit A
MINNHIFQNLDFIESYQSLYLDYSHMVATDRALPDLFDGLKPLQRRIVYTMHVRGDYQTFIKSSKICGDVMGDYHPHGNLCIYEGLCVMVHKYFNRAPLLLGYGSFGSLDGDKAAAERYTAVKLSPLAKLLCEDLRYNPVDTNLNYNSTLYEPQVLPVRYPVLLVSGQFGIGVGLSVSLPSHNPIEIMDACIARLEDNECEIHNIIKGPDFITGGIICNHEVWKNIVDTGRGSLRIRAKYHIYHNLRRIDILQIPGETRKVALVLSIHEAHAAGKLPGLISVFDNSRELDVKIELKYNASVNPETLVNSLFKYTLAETQISYNTMAVAYSKPVQVNLSQIINNFLSFRERTLLRIFNNKINFHYEALKRALIILVVQKKTTKIVNIIRKSEDPVSLLRELISSPEIMRLINRKGHKHFARIFADLSINDTKKILDIRLGKLALDDGRQQEKIVSDILTEIEHLQGLLNSADKRAQYLLEELQETKKVFSSYTRRTELQQYIAVMEDADTVASSIIICCLTKNGYLITVQDDDIRGLNRNTQGQQVFKMQKGDEATAMIRCSNKDKLLLITNKGMLYQVTDLFNEHNVYLPNKISLGKDERILSLFRLGPDSKGVVILSNHSHVKYMEKSLIESVNRGGKKILPLGAEVTDAKVHDDDTHITVFTKNGNAAKYLLTPENFRPMGRLALGVKAASMGKNDQALSILLTSEDDKLAIMDETGNTKLILGKDIREVSRPATGVRVTRKGRKLLTCFNATNVPYLLMFRPDGLIIKIKSDQFKLMNRRAMGTISVKNTSNLLEKFKGLIANYQPDLPQE